MSGYAAMTSLKRTIWGIYRAPAVYRNLSSALDGVESLQEVLEQVDDSSGSERVDALEGQIREAAYELEDSLESHVLDLFEAYELEDSLESHVSDLSLLQSEESFEVKQYVDSFTQKVVKIKEEYIDELTNQYDFGASSSIAGFGGKMPKMVGLSDELSKIKGWLMDSDTGRLSISMFGMAGTGKTTLAREIFEDPSILQHFDSRVWVTIGPKYNINEIRHCIVAQANPENYKELLVKGNKHSIHYYLERSLSSRYLIVLDDVWDYDMYDSLVSKFPGTYYGSRVLVTTRMVDVAYRMNRYKAQETRLMNEEESWDLLHEKVFGKEYSCPPELEKAGKEIAKNCEGYPPQIIKLAQLLSKSERTAECWSKMAETGNSVFMEANNEGLDSVSSRIDSDGKKPVTVGLSDDLTKIKDWLKRSSYPLEAISLVGMAGIGKTTLAKEVFEDPSILHHFDVRVWITIGPEYQVKEILQGIAVQVSPGADIDIEMLDWHLYRSLKDRRYLIVLDDVWDAQILVNLKTCCPDSKNGSKFLVTTELRDALRGFPYALSEYYVRIHEMHLLNNEESWCLLRQKVFGEEYSCPFELEKAGKKIAEKCEGLPLAIVTVANLLSKEKRTPDCWNEIATTEENSVFCEAYDQMSNKFIRSYNYLPRYLKPCFLYMGVFSKNYMIPGSKLIRMWNVEGFMEEDAGKCFRELIARSLVVCKQSSSTGTTKTCKLHSVIWHMCNRTAEKNKFFHALSRWADAFAEGIISERRLSVRNSVLFHIRDVYNSMASIRSLRSLLCTGPHYQYSIQICSAWRLLKVLDAHTIRFYQFPIEAIELVRLRYFAITYNGKLPPSIYKLRNLEYLIVHRLLGIKFFEDSSYLPVEIWKMRALKHLQVTGSNLPDPPDGARLEYLSTLLDVSARSCTRKVLERIPKLEKLGIHIELPPDVDVVPLCCFDISYLYGVKSLRCVFMNPEVEVVKPPIFLPRTSYNFTKLTLCGFGYPWEYLSIISSWKYLQVLKLRSYAFCGPTWGTFERQFERLKLLVLEDLDLVHLNGISSRFPVLERLIIRYCYKLKGIPSEIGDMRYLKLIELVDCSPLVVDLAEDIREQRNKKDYRYLYPELEVRSHCSWK